jgi:hypothetical protein
MEKAIPASRRRVNVEVMSAFMLQTVHRSRLGDRLTRHRISATVTPRWATIYSPHVQKERPEQQRAVFS